MESDTILSILSEMEEEEGAGSYLLQIPIQNFQRTLHPSSNIWKNKYGDALFFQKLNPIFFQDFEPNKPHLI